MLDTPEPDLAYLFKHIITQEVAYSLLLFAQRRQLHRAVAEWYERTQADDLASLYPLLAYHWGRAEEPTKTLAYLELAGEQALRAGAYQEAVDFLTDAVALAGTIQPPPRRCGRRAGTANSATPTWAWAACPRAASTPTRRWPCWARRCRRRRCGWSATSAEQALRQSFHRIWPARPGQVPGAARGAALEATRAFERLAFLNYYANARGRVSALCSIRSTWPSGLGHRRSWRARTRR